MTRKHFFTMAVIAILAFMLSGCGFTAINLNPDVPIIIRAEPDYPKAIVIFDSWSGNTTLVAEVIAEQLNAPAVSVAQTCDYDMADFDLIVVGSPVHGGRPTEEIKAFLAELPKPCMSAVFVTFGAPLFGPMTANACLKKMEKSLQGTSLGKFKCHGRHKILRTYPSHPDEKDTADATRFALELLDRCQNNSQSISSEPIDEEN